MNINWNGLCFAATFFVAGILGLIYKQLTVPICITILILGLLGIVLFGMPFWRKIFKRYKKKWSESRNFQFWVWVTFTVILALVAVGLEWLGFTRMISILGIETAAKITFWFYLFLAVALVFYVVLAIVVKSRKRP
jgi:hypothetical protein